MDDAPRRTGSRRRLLLASLGGVLVVGTAIGAALLSAHGDAGTTLAPSTAAPTGTSASATSAPPLGVGFLSTDGARIVDSTGATVVLRAVNWFGLETSSCAPHGLDRRSVGQILDQIAGFGFTTIRLPWSNQCLDGAPPRGIDATRNPDLAGKSALEVMDAVIAGARARGMSVLLDRHRPGYDAQSALWYTDAYPEQQWIADWVMLAERYRDDPTVIGADLHNEPRGPACWACADPARDWAAAATRAGDAILAVQPRWLIVVEGVQTMGDGTSTWWGSGLSDVRDHPISLTVADRVVYSAHDYPASVYPQGWFFAPTYPANLAAIWDANWGYLVHEGIAPVFLGEFGTLNETESDRIWLSRLVQYLHDGGFSFGFWSYNPDSGDTGGLVRDDWVTPEQAKLDALAPLLH